MFSFWLVVSLYILSAIISLVAFTSMASRGVDEVKVEPNFGSFSIFLGALFAWLYYVIFKDNWNNLAVLITIIWASRWVAYIYPSIKGYTATMGTYLFSFLVCVLQVVLLLIYHFRG